MMSDEITVTPEQIKAARALLAMSQQDLAAEAHVASSTIADFERKARNPMANNVTAIRSVLEAAGLGSSPAVLSKMVCFRPRR
jgi:DNA-binding transcriptional regulator YiaG